LGKTIIVTTLQKFPVIAKEIGELPGKRASPYPKRTSAGALHMSPFGGKADIGRLGKGKWQKESPPM
jgi:hypothetical protein